MNTKIEEKTKEPPKMTPSDDLKLPESITQGKKFKPEKYMVLQMGQGEDEEQDRAIIEYLSKNALAIQHHPGAVQFQVSKKMLAELKAKFQKEKQQKLQAEEK